MQYPLRSLLSSEGKKLNYSPTLHCRATAFIHQKKIEDKARELSVILESELNLLLVLTDTMQQSGGCQWKLPVCDLVISISCRLQRGQSAVCLYFFYGMLLRLHTQNPTPTSRPSFVGENSLSSFFSVWTSNHSNSVHLLILILVWIRVYLREASSDRPGRLVGDCLGPQHHSRPPYPPRPSGQIPQMREPLFCIQPGAPKGASPGLGRGE